MANADIIYTPDPDAESISSDVAEFNGVLVSTQIPTRADGSLELGDIVAQSECTLQALKVALEKAGSVQRGVPAFLQQALAGTRRRGRGRAGGGRHARGSDRDGRQALIDR